MSSKFHLSDRSYQAHRLHQFRVEARLTCEQVDLACGLKPGRCYAIEYKQAGHVDEIKQIIQQFVPGERRLRGIGVP